MASKPPHKVGASLSGVPPLDLDAIRQRLQFDETRTRHDDSWHTGLVSRGELKALLAEVERLRAEIDVLRPPAENYNRTLARAEHAEAELATLRAKVDELEHQQSHHASELRAAKDLWKRQKAEIQRLRAVQTWQPRQLMQDLVDAVDHLEICGSCGEDSFSACTGGQDALKARAQAKEWLAALPPAPEAPPT